jgi:hypothetical protein
VERILSERVYGRTLTSLLKDVGYVEPLPIALTDNLSLGLHLSRNRTLSNSKSSSVPHASSSSASTPIVPSRGRPDEDAPVVAPSTNDSKRATVNGHRVTNSTNIPSIGHRSEHAMREGRSRAPRLLPTSIPPASASPAASYRLVPPRVPIVIDPSYDNSSQRAEGKGDDEETKAKQRYHEYRSLVYDEIGLRAGARTSNDSPLVALTSFDIMRYGAALTTAWTVRDDTGMNLGWPCL